MRTAISLPGLLLLLPLLAVLAAGLPSAAADSDLIPEGLLCEYQVNPLGLDTLAPRLSWRLPPGPRGRAQRAYQILVASSPELLRKGQGDLWDTGRVVSPQQVLVPYAGAPLGSRRRCYWQVRVWDEAGRRSGWSLPARWSQGLLERGDWTGRYIGQAPPPGAPEGRPLPFPWLRKRFTLSGNVREATAYVNPLGYYELYVNGRKVDDHVLSPVPSDFSRRSIFVTHDIAPYLRPGENCVALWLGRGWYVRGHAGVIHDGPLVRAQLEIDLEDTRGPASRVTVATDGTWKLRRSPLSPLGRGLAFGDYGGERVEAALDLPNWNSTELDDSAWENAAEFEPPAVTVAAQNVEPNRIIQSWRAVRVTQPAPGEYQLDMGRNLVGWLELALPDDLAAGSVVRLDYSDGAQRGGMLATHNQYDEYVARGGGGESFRSRFNYHGFRYVRIRGLPRAPKPEHAVGHLIHTAYGNAGSFECSDPLLNRIHELMTYTYRCLTLGGYVVDCPTRERLGYGGDAGTSMETGMYNFAVGALYNRWGADWRAAQHPETGDLPFTAPHYQDRGGGGPMWSGFVVTLPWQQYLHYGDRGALAAFYPTIQRWLDYLGRGARDHLLEGHSSYAILLPEWTFLGDWLAPRPAGGGPRGRGSLDSIRFINSCHYLLQLQLASRIAGVLGKHEDAERYARAASAVRTALHARYFNPDSSTYATGEQPYLAFPLLIGAVPEEHRPAVQRKLEETIRVVDDGHINAGMHGTYFLLKYLTAADRSDLVHLMLTRTTFPSWGYMLAQGATTSWESWSGGGSHIHDTLISAGGWFYEGLAGIRPDERSPGFRHFTVRPAVVGDLSFVRARHLSPYGEIESSWRARRAPGGTLRELHLEVTVPPGSLATVHVRAVGPEQVREGDVPALQAPGVRFIGMSGGHAMFRVPSGTYRFTSTLG